MSDLLPFQPDQTKPTHSMLCVYVCVRFKQMKKLQSRDLVINPKVNVKKLCFVRYQGYHLILEFCFKNHEQ